MAEPLGPSFIPKQNPAKSARRTASRQVYLFTVVSYVGFFATLVAVVALFIYSRLIAQNVAEVVSSYDTEIESFNQNTMFQVIELDERLKRTAELLDANISLRAALAVIDAVTIDTVQFTQLALERGEDNQVTLDAVVSTDSFDSVLFQQEIYEKAQRLDGAAIKGVTIQFLQADAESGTPRSSRVGFSASFDLAPEDPLSQSELNATESNFFESNPEPIETIVATPAGDTSTTSTSTNQVATSSPPQLP